MSRTIIGIDHQNHAAPAAQRTRGRHGWGRPHPRAASALGATFLVVTAAAGCTAEQAERSDVDSAASSEVGSAPSTAVDVPLLREQPDAQPLAPGRYALDPFDEQPSAPMAPVLQVPEGYVSIGGAGVRATDDLGNRVVWLWDVTSVFTHPCDVSGHPESVGPSVADLAGALAAQPMREATDPVAITIGGHDGLYVELSTPDDISTCHEGYFRSWPGREDNSPGLTDLIWVVEVEGQRITFDLSYPPGTTPQQVEELREMVTTATFTRRQGM